MQNYEVSFTVLTQPRTNSFLGAGRSDMSNLTTTVQAMFQGQAQALVEGQFGGKDYCIIHSVRPL